MMEKYGVSMEELPPTDEQLKLLSAMLLHKSAIYSAPKNRQEAEDMIEKLSAEKDD